MSNRRILVIGWYFPPINSSEGLVTYKLLKNTKFENYVIMKKNNDDWSYKRTDLECDASIRRIYSNTDDVDTFADTAINYYKTHRGEYDIVMTRSMPEEDHKVGLKIKELDPDIYWIASFGDPIANNPYVLKGNVYYNKNSVANRGMSKALSPKRILKSIYYKESYKKNVLNKARSLKELQKQILQKADCVICNSDYEKDYLLTVFNSEKDYENPLDIKNADESKANCEFIIIPHSFDAELYPRLVDKNIDKGKQRFIYIGHLDDIRSPRALFKALKMLKAKDSCLADKMEFNFYGEMGNKDKLFLMDNELLDLVKFHKDVDYLTSLRIMSEADWLLHIDADISTVIPTNIFFAAKLADYIGTGNRIFGMTMIDGISKDILSEYGALCTELSASEIANYLYLIIYEGYDISVNKDVIAKYDAKNVASVFDATVENILNEKRSCK